MKDIAYILQPLEGEDEILMLDAKTEKWVKK